MQSCGPPGMEFETNGLHHTPLPAGGANQHSLLKCPYYEFLKITFHAVCNTALK